MTLRAKLLAGLVASFLVLGLAACSDDDGGDATDETTDDTGDTGTTVSAEEFVAGVCTSVDDWGTTFTESESLGDAEGKDEVLDILDGVKSATATFVADLEASGVPDIAGGEEIAETLVTTAQEFESAIDTAIAGVEELPADAPEAAIQPISAALESAFDSLENVFSNPPPELEDVVDEAPECEGVL